MTPPINPKNSGLDSTNLPDQNDAGETLSVSSGQPTPDPQVGEDSDAFIGEVLPQAPDGGLSHLHHSLLITDEIPAENDGTGDASVPGGSEPAPVAEIEAYADGELIRPRLEDGKLLVTGETVERIRSYKWEPVFIEIEGRPYRVVDDKRGSVDRAYIGVFRDSMGNVHGIRFYATSIINSILNDKSLTSEEYWAALTSDDDDLDLEIQILSKTPNPQQAREALVAHLHENSMDEALAFLERFGQTNWRVVESEEEGLGLLREAARVGLPYEMALKRVTHERNRIWVVQLGLNTLFDEPIGKDELPFALYRPISVLNAGYSPNLYASEMLKLVEMIDTSLIKKDRENDSIFDTRPKKIDRFILIGSEAETTIMAHPRGFGFFAATHEGTRPLSPAFVQEYRTSKGGKFIEILGFEDQQVPNELNQGENISSRGVHRGFVEGFEAGLRYAGSHSRWLYHQLAQAESTDEVERLLLTIRARQLGINVGGDNKVRAYYCAREGRRDKYHNYQGPIVAGGTVPFGSDTIYWFVIDDEGEKRDRILAVDAEGNFIPYGIRVAERARLKKLIVESGNRDWQAIGAVFEHSDIVRLESLQQGYELFAQIARSNFPYEVGLKMVYENGEFVPYARLGKKGSVKGEHTQEGELFSVSILHNHPLTNWIISVGGEKAEIAVYRPSGGNVGGDLLSFHGRIKKCEERIKSGEFDENVEIDGFRDSNGTYYTGVTSHHGAIQIQYRADGSEGAEIKVLYADTRPESEQATPEQILSVVQEKLAKTTTIVGKKPLFNATVTSEPEQVSPQEFHSRTGIDVRFESSQPPVQITGRLNVPDVMATSAWAVGRVSAMSLSPAELVNEASLSISLLAQGARSLLTDDLPDEAASQIIGGKGDAVAAVGAASLPRTREVNYLEQFAPLTDSGKDPKASDIGFTIVGVDSKSFRPGRVPITQQQEAEFIWGNAEPQTVRFGAEVFGSSLPEDWETTVLESIAQAERKGLTEVVHYLEFASDKEAMELFTDEKEIYQRVIENGYTQYASQLSQSDQKLSDHHIIQINAAIISGAPVEVARLVETIVPEVPPTTLPENEMMILGNSPNGVMRSTSVLRVVR